MTITKEESNYIKLIAIITMAIDHIGVMLFPDAMWLRIIGRIAFPLFAYQLVIGYIHTRNFKKYILRLLGLGILCQIPFSYATDEKLFNILFTLVVGLVCIYFIDKKKITPILMIMMITYVLENYSAILNYLNIKSGIFFAMKDYIACYDYGLYGLLTIIMIYLLINKKELLAISFTGLNAIFVMYYGTVDLQAYSLLAILFLNRPLKLKFNIPGWFFYWFYPIHIGLIYAVKVLWF